MIVSLRGAHFAAKQPHLKREIAAGKDKRPLAT